MHERIAPRRATPYPGPGAIFHAPVHLWRATIVELRRYASARSEALVLWGGVVGGNHIVVTGLYVLGHSAQGGTVKATPEELRWLLRVLRSRDEKLVAQVHSHPGEAYHSPGDDAHAATFHDGFLSIVAPYFGMKVRDPDDCAVYECEKGCFRRLPQAQVRARVKVWPTVVRRSDNAGGELATTKVRSAGWLYSLVSSLKQKFIGQRRR